MQEKRSKEEDERKAREEKEKREKVLIEIEKPSEGLCESRKIPCFTYLGNDQLASQCSNERCMILRDKNENSSQEKEASESDKNVKMENQEKTLGKQKAWEKSVPSHEIKFVDLRIDLLKKEEMMDTIQPHSSP